MNHTEEKMNVPQGLKLANTDEWASVDGNIAVVGVSDYAQEQLSDVVFVEIMVEVGDVVAKGSTIATIESVKAAADVNAPISGKVIEVNGELPNAPDKINTDPYGEAWMIKVELSDPKELDTLMDAEAYTAYCETRSH